MMKDKNEFEEDKFNEKEATEEMKQRLKSLFEDEGNRLAEDHEHNLKYKITQLNMLLNFMNFLKNYDEHIKVLNEYIKNNRWKSKERGDE